jgi:hypothetical protein
MTERGTKIAIYAFAVGSALFLGAALMIIGVIEVGVKLVAT